MATLAFYKGRAKKWRSWMADMVIRIATLSKYSHVELIEGKAEYDKPALCWSASGRDGGVRKKTITLRRSQWDLVHVPDAPKNAIKFIQNFEGKKYDYRGIVFSQAVPLGGQDDNKWFCSEICGRALGFGKAHRLSPGKLFKHIKQRLGR